jgi:hypothetical protein
MGILSCDVAQGLLKTSTISLAQEALGVIHHAEESNALRFRFL